jgi:predicted DNA binding CopG/RHH family protein
MANPKRTKFNAAIKKIPKVSFSREDILSHDLAERLGKLDDKTKITIRIDLRVLDSAKKEADQLGVGYQKIINDRLLEIYSFAEAPYLKKESSSEVNELTKQINDLNKRLNKVERIQEKKQA